MRLRTLSALLFSGGRRVGSGVVAGFSRSGVLAVVAVAVVSGGFGVVGQSAARASGPVSGGSLRAPVLGATTSFGQEVPGLRTRMSRTYLLVDQGRPVYQAVFSTVPLNYQDATGAWLPVDTSLVSDGSGGFVSKAGAVSVHLPSSLASAVTVASGGSMVSERLVGAAGSARASGDAASYSGALAGVDVRYQALAEGVKESLVLRSARAPASFAFELGLPAGFTASATAAGAVSVMDQGGVQVFALQAPSVVDASGAAGTVSARLAPAAAGFSLLQVSVDPVWLHAAGRVFPVTVDPTITAGATQDCTLAQAAPTTGFCAQTTLAAGWDATNASRSVLSFDVSSLNNRVQVINADLQLYLQSETSSTPVSVSAYPVTRAFTGSATWNRYDGTNAWSAAGGDFGGLADTNASVGGSTGVWADWYPIQLVQGWVNGSIPNDGILLKQTSESQNNVLSFASSQAAANKPLLVVRYVAELGLVRQASYDTQTLSSNLSASVNRANGNLVLQQHLFTLAGTGMSVSATPVFNNLDAVAWSLGTGWMVGGVDNYLLVEPKAVVISGPFADGRGLFLQNSDGTSYQPAPGWDASLVKNPDGTFTLTWDRSGEKDTYPAGGGSVSKQVDRNGNTISYLWEGDGDAQSITDTQGHTISFSYNGSDQLTSITDSADARSWTFGWGSNGMLHTYTDPNAKTTTFNYDSSENLTQVIDPLGNQTDLSYDGWWRVTSLTRVTDPVHGTGPTTSFSYQSAGSACPAGALGQMVETDPRSHATTYCYDSQLRIVKAIDPDGHTVSADFTNANGGSNCADNNPCSTTDALGKTTTFGYNPGGTSLQQGENQLWSQSPLEGTSNRPTITYGTIHLTDPAQYTDPQYAGPGTGKHSWLYSYDTPGNLTQKSEGDSGAGQNPVSFTYNSDGTLATATDSKSNLTQYCYGSGGSCTGATTHLLTKVVQPSPLGATSISYDSFNRIQTISDGKGQTRTYTYDTLDRVTQIAYSGGPTLTYGYDADGNLTSTTDPSGTTSYHYDALNRLTSEDQPGPRTISYGYDDASNLTSLTDASGTTGYTYNSENQAASLLEPGASTAIAFSYDGNGNRTQIAYPNGVSEVLQYDDAGRITRVYAEKPLGSGNILTSFTYSYNVGTTDTSLRQTMTALYAGSPASTSYYCYDGLSRLVSADTASATCPNASAAYQYTYDSAGNMTSKTINGTTTNYTVNAANQLTNTGHSFDSNGSQTADPGTFTNTTYNTLDQATSITPTGGSAFSLAYAGLNQANRVTNGAISQINDQLGLNQDTGSPNTFFTRDPGGAMLGERHSGSYYYLHDGLGSTVAVTDSSGTIVATYKYDPYGNNTATTGSLYQPIRYAGGYWDQNTPTHEALYKYGQRYYDPTLGRWTQPDPINNPLDLHGWNGYTYAGDDPVNNTDPSGLCSWYDVACDVHSAADTFAGAIHTASQNLTAFVTSEVACGIAVGLVEVITPVGTALVCAVAGLETYYRIHDALQSGLRGSSSRLHHRRTR
ncbi:MAG: RHS repeat-associated core domain-containing protein [Gaiellaceae bacterium]